MEELHAHVRGLCDDSAHYGTIQRFPKLKNGNQYALTPDSATLQSQNAAYTGGTIEFLLSPELRLGFDDIAATVRKVHAQTEPGATAPHILAGIRAWHGANGH